MGKYYVISRTLNKSIATEVANTLADEYVYEVKVKLNAGHTDGQYEVRLYHNGEWADREQNGWRFSKLIYGHYKQFDPYTSTESTTFSIEALSTENEDVKLQYENWTTCLGPSGLVDAIYNQMNLVSSLCKTRSEYEKMSDLFTIKFIQPSLSDIIHEFQLLHNVKQISEKMESDSHLKAYFNALLSSRLEKLKHVVQSLSI